MVTRDMLFSSLESAIKLAEQALQEREEAQRALCHANGVKSWDDIGPYEMWKLGADLESQIEDLNDLIDELKYKIKYISAFADII